MIKCGSSNLKRDIKDLPTYYDEIALLREQIDREREGIRQRNAERMRRAVIGGGQNTPTPPDRDINIDI